MARASHFRAVSCKRGRASARKRPVHPALENAPFAASEIALPRFLKQILKPNPRSEEHTSELQSLMRISYAVFCLKKKTKQNTNENKHKLSQQYSHPKYYHIEL